MRRSKVSAKVGIACFGSFLVLAFEIPSAPYQFCSLIKPGYAMPLEKLLLRNLLLSSYNKDITYLSCLSSELNLRVELKRIKLKTLICIHQNNNILKPYLLGSWNMTTTPSRVTWTSVVFVCYEALKRMRERNVTTLDSLTSIPDRFFKTC